VIYRYGTGVPRGIQKVVTRVTGVAADAGARVLTEEKAGRFTVRRERPTAAAVIGPHHAVDAHPKTKNV